MVESGDIMDIAYIPGIANTNLNMYVLDIANAQPYDDKSAQKGSVEAGKKGINYSVPITISGLGYCSNIVDKKTWRYMSNGDTNAWVLQDEYIPPMPYGKPILCTNIDDFVANFGDSPYTFVNDIPITTSDGNTTLLFKESDVEPSYLMAKELISSGIPVYYMNNNTPNSVFSDDINNVYSKDVLRKVILMLRYYLQHLDYDVETLETIEHMVEEDTESELYKLYYSNKLFQKFPFNYFSHTTRGSATAKDLASFRKVYSAPLNTSNIVDKMFGNMLTNLSDIVDGKNEYRVKYVTNGAFSSFGYDVTTVDYIGDNTFYYNGGWKPISESSKLSFNPKKTAIALLHTKSTPFYYVIDDLENSHTFSFSYDFTNEFSDISGDKVATIEINFNTTDNITYATINVTSNNNALLTKIQDGVTIALVDVSNTPIVEFDPTKALLKAAYMRGDCIALIDATNDPTKPLDKNNEDSVYYQINSIITQHHIEDDVEIYDGYCEPIFNNDGKLIETKDFGSYGFMLYPHSNYKFDGSTSAIVPGSFVYLKALSNAMKSNKQWESIAGVSNGTLRKVKSLCTLQPMTQKIADSYQDKDEGNINGIVNILNNGYTVWGNRTLRNNKMMKGLTATSFINIRSILCDINKCVYHAAKKLLFEQNNNELWINFKSSITPKLDKMVTSCALKKYKIIRVETKEPTKVCAIIHIIPTYAVEEFEVTVQITNNDEIEVTVNKE